MVLVAAGLTWWLDAMLLHRVSSGTDHAARLAAVLTYVGVDGAYTLARAFGITALVFAYATILIGLSSSPAAPDGREGLAALHRQTGAATVVLVAAHAAVPFSSAVPPYGGWRTNFLPWAQPVSWGIKAASWESLGLLAFYLVVLTGPTYYLVQRRRGVWRIVHRVAVAAYALAVAHAFLLGTDFLVSGPARLALLAAQIPVLVLLGRRMMRTGTRVGRTGALVAAIAVAGVAALTLLSVTGEYAQGMRL